MTKKGLVLLFFILYHISVLAQTSKTERNFFYADTVFHPQRATTLGIGVGATYAFSMVGLYQLWYSEYPSSKFHIFNDVQEWQQMDKIGHTGSAYYLSRWSYNLIAWTGANKRKAAIYGSGMGILYQSTIEVFDGFSSEWGFSIGDMSANTAGSLLFLSQQLAWQEQRIQLKFSFHTTKFSNYRPALLGSNFPERIVKDYNGQTYWLSTGISSWLPLTSRFPKWINVAIGYGAEGMIGAVTNPIEVNKTVIPSFIRYRQFYLSPDIDLTKIKTRSGFLSALFATFGFIKIPAPALELNTQNKLVFKPFYF